MSVASFLNVYKDKLEVLLRTSFPRRSPVFDKEKILGYKLSGETQLAFVQFMNSKFAGGIIYDYQDGTGLKFQLCRYMEREEGNHIRVEGSVDVSVEDFLKEVNR